MKFTLIIASLMAIITYSMAVAPAVLFQRTPQRFQCYQVTCYKPNFGDDQCKRDCGGIECSAQTNKCVAGSKNGTSTSTSTSTSTRASVRASTTCNDMLL
ncbi:hypothetical protein CLAFUW4_08315 [Fulvia fulva]|uniref:Uncharacterized protein n=1 Tax=Passalora fulva TaxID=5499 RepID=A0A9Q8P6D9_PASFU|nr:uncharacterized protein CLAFUR5_08423 [Fulvia fulva]KAK4629109.1 hypothetical protein CLAFUR4_08320 [Fulvia fulva]KAK4630263.1 hypothetical protein CLAFUR0_08315 [Fulvia fulva]UJO14851.1 hypothetical protein CLAFUR5_08423 [Fulvia fulva]WPV12619.1 hypothetical protein CLAFUW4_08315 [Fulvia fulva]WPV27894.1 hypothetical protein CLAFUW7_08315 [Fulvia fulva]